jgi:hypothetical protein
MERERDSTIAYRMIAKFGDHAVETINAIVANHEAADEAEGAAFWKEVGSIVRRLQAAITITEDGRSGAHR